MRLVQASKILLLLAIGEQTFANASPAGAGLYVGEVPVYNFDPNAIGTQSAREWVLVTKPAASDAQVHSLCGQEAGECINEGHPDEGGFGFASVKGTFDEVKALAERHGADLEFIEPAMTMSATPIDQHEYNGSFTSLLEGSTDRWGLDRIDDKSGLDGSYNAPNTGKGVHVYVLDTGIRTTHSDFGGRAFPAVDATLGRLKVCSSNDRSCANDRMGHGTHCAGTVGGKKSGVAKGVTIHAGKVLSDQGSGSTSGILAAMDWVVQKGKRPAVISMSLGGPGVSQAFSRGIDQATSRGVTVVVAAGNDNQDACGISPAHVRSAITVGATDNKDRRAGFSNYGSCIDIFGPGVDILSAYKSNDNSFSSMSGTSMACPHVAGAAALLLEKSKSMKPQAVASALASGAIKGAVKDPRSNANLLLHVGGGGGGGGSPPSPSPGSPSPSSPSPSSPSPGGGGKGGKGGESPSPSSPSPDGGGGKGGKGGESPSPASPSPSSPSPFSPSPGGGGGKGGKGISGASDGNRRRRRGGN